MSRVDEIRKRLEAATKGPWAVRERGYGWAVDAPEHVICALNWTKYKREEANTRFIAAAPEDCSYLLGRVEKLEGLLGMLVAAADSEMDFEDLGMFAWRHLAEARTLLADESEENEENEHGSK